MLGVLLILVFVVIPTVIAYRTGGLAPIILPGVLFAVGVVGVLSGSDSANPDETDVLPAAYAVIGAVGAIASLLAGGVGSQRRQ